jgi:hypothetical protein
MSEHTPFVRRNFWAVLQIPRQTPYNTLIPACDDSGLNAGFHIQDATIATTTEESYVTGSLTRFLRLVMSCGAMSITKPVNEPKINGLTAPDSQSSGVLMSGTISAAARDRKQSLRHTLKAAVESPIILEASCHVSDN